MLEVAGADYHRRDGRRSVVVTGYCGVATPTRLRYRQKRRWRSETVLAAGSFTAAGTTTRLAIGTCYRLAAASRRRGRARR